MRSTEATATSHRTSNIEHRTTNTEHLCRRGVLVGGGDGGVDALAALPAGGEEGQEVADLVGVLLQLLEHEVAAQAGCGRDVDGAVGRVDGRVPGDDVALPGDVEVVEQLLDEQVRRAGADLDADGGRDRALGLVGGDDAVVGVGHGADHPGPQDAAHGRGVRLEDVDGVVGEELGELVRRREALAGGDGDGQLTGDLGGGVDLGVVGRLLEPGRVDLGELVADLDGLGNGEAAVALDHELDVRPDGGADGPADVHREAAVGGVHVAPGGAEGVELEGAVAAGDDHPGALGEDLRGAVALVPAVGVDGEAGAVLAAEEVVDGPAGLLADDVPAGGLDGGGSVGVDLAAVGVQVAGHALVDGLDLEGVHALVAVGELVDGGLDGLGEAVEGALADAVEAGGVGVEADEEPVLPRVADGVGGGAGDADHGCLSGYGVRGTEYGVDCRRGVERREEGGLRRHPQWGMIVW